MSEVELISKKDEYWKLEGANLRWKDNPKEYKKVYNRWYIRKNKSLINKRRREHYKKHREKDLEIQNRWKRNNPERVLLHAFKSQTKKKLKIMNKLGGKCSKCGYSKLSGLVVHHLNPEEKERDNDYLKVGYDLSKVVLLCSNCHRELHFNYKWEKWERMNNVRE